MSEEYVLTRISEDEDSILCEDGEKQFTLPKSRCRIVQQDYFWDKQTPDIIVIRIPDDLADKHDLD